MIELCPICKKSVTDDNCLNCGWPHESFSGEYIFPKDGEKLNDYQPNLEFFSEKTFKWFKSGIINGTMVEGFRGFYRSKVKNF